MERERRGGGGRGEPRHEPTERERKENRNERGNRKEATKEEECDWCVQGSVVWGDVWKYWELLEEQHRRSESVSARGHMTAVVCRDTLTSLQKRKNQGNISRQTHCSVNTVISRHITSLHILSNDDSTPHPATGLSVCVCVLKKKEEIEFFLPHRSVWSSEHFSNCCLR